jgi:hypothetical protein
MERELTHNEKGLSQEALTLFDKIYDRLIEENPFRDREDASYEAITKAKQAAKEK